MLQLRQQAEGPAPALLTPVLRSIGNLVAAGAPADLLPAFSSDEAHLQRLLACSQGRHQGIQKEALWVLSNFAALVTSDRSASSRSMTKIGFCSGERLTHTFQDDCSLVWLKLFASPG